MPVRRPAREQKSPSIQGFRSKATLRGRPLGIKLAEHRAIKRKLADIAGGRLGRRRRRGVVGLEIDDQDLALASPPAGRFAPKPAPAARPAAPAVRRSRPRRGCRRRKPRAKRASAISASTFAASASRSPSVQPSALRARYFSAASRRRSAARSGSDCSSRCTSVPRCSARARSSTDSPGSDAVALVRSPCRRDAAGRRRRFAPAAAVRSHAGSATRRARGRSAGSARRPPAVLGPRVAFHRAVRRLDGLLRASQELASPLSIRSYQQSSRTLFLLPGMQPRDDQPVGRARHRHIEQPAILVLGLVQHRRARRGDGRRIVGLPAGPDHDLAAVAAAADGSAAAAAYPTARRWCRP